MKQLFLLLALLIPPAALMAGGLYVDLAPSLGMYLPPDTVRGYYDGGYATYPLVERSSSGSSYNSGNRYRFTEAFASDLAANWGLGFQIGYRFNPTFSMGLEADWSRSFGYAVETGSFRDSMSGSAYSYFGLPYDYGLTHTEVKTRTALIATHMGICLSITRPLPKNQWFLHFGSGVGSASYQHEYQVEYPSIIHTYHQFNGNQIYADTSSSGFSRYRIEYQAVYFRPFATVEYAFDSTLSLFSGISCALSYIYEGTDASSSDYYNSYNNGYLPDDPFMMGDLRLTAGVRLNFPNRRAPHK